MVSRQTASVRITHNIIKGYKEGITESQKQLSQHVFRPSGQNVGVITVVLEICSIQIGTIHLFTYLNYNSTGLGVRINL